jgi:hypothetical protein
MEHIAPKESLLVDTRLQATRKQPEKIILLEDQLQDKVVKDAVRLCENRLERVFQPARQGIFLVGQIISDRPHRRFKRSEEIVIPSRVKFDDGAGEFPQHLTDGRLVVGQQEKDVGSDGAERGIGWIGSSDVSNLGGAQTL